MPKRIIAVGHDAYRAGAQIAFLHTLGWLRTNYDADLSLILSSDGELVGNYADVLPTTVLERALDPATASTRALVRQRVARRLRGHRRLVKPDSADLIYANSAASAALAADLAGTTGSPVVCHVHELELSMRRFAGRFDRMAARFDGFIAVSQAVERNLVANHGVDAQKIDVVNPPAVLPARAADDGRAERLRNELGIPPAAFVVGGCGTLDWRKGPDVFVLIARALVRRTRDRPVHFLWVGGEPEDVNRLRYDVERAGLAETVRFLGASPEPAPYFELFDVFLLPSREDPFPLVCLEAASFGVPVVCFADAGGMPEFVEDDAGYVVPYLDIDSAADRLCALAGSPTESAAMGRRAAAKATQRCSMDVVGPQVAAVLDRHVRPVAPSPEVRAHSDQGARL